MRPSNPPRNVASFKNAESVATAPQLRAAACDGALSASAARNQCFNLKMFGLRRWRLPTGWFFCLNRCNERAARTRPMCPRAKVIKRADAVWIEPRYEAEVAEPSDMTLQILFGVVGMSMWLTP
jgi:hypothetical protein